MYCIIEYTDCRKEQTIFVHGYSINKDTAINLTKQLVKKETDKYGGYLTEFTDKNDICNIHLKLSLIHI